MVQAWEFGGRPVVLETGKRAARHFGFRPRSASVGNELDELVQCAENALRSEGCQVKHVGGDARVASALPSDEVPLVSLTAALAQDLCQLRLDFFGLDELLVVESRRLWGP